MKKATALLALSLCLTTLTLSSCGEGNREQLTKDFKDIYYLALERGFSGSYSDWIIEIQTKANRKGVDIVDIEISTLNDTELKAKVSFINGTAFNYEIKKDEKLPDNPDAPKKYTITFNVDGVEYKKIEVQEGTKVKEPESPTKDGYVFEGWFLGDKEWSFIGYVVTENMVLEAKFVEIQPITPEAPTTVKVSFKVGEEIVKTTDVVKGTKVKEPTKPTKAGYTFAGWYLESEEWSFIGYIVTEDMTLEAKFVEVIPDNPEETTVKVNYKVDGQIIDTVIVNKGTKLKQPTKPTKDGYTFEGWFIEDEKWSFVGFIVTEDITLTAKFTKIEIDQPEAAVKCKVDFVVDGVVVTTTEVAKGTKAKQPSKPVKEGYVFDGWYLEDEKWSFIGFNVTEDITLTAKFIKIEQEAPKKIAVNYLVDGAIIKTEYYEKGDRISKPADPNKEGFIFEGWFVGEVKWDFFVYVLSDDINLEAKFVAKDSLVVLNADIIKTSKLNKSIEIQLGLSGSGSTYVNLDQVKVTCSDPSVMTISGNSIVFNKIGTYTLTFESERYNPTSITFEIIDIYDIDVKNAVDKASTLSEQELVALSQSEMKYRDEVFEIKGITALLKKAVYEFAKKYPHLYLAPPDASELEHTKDNISVRTYKLYEYNNLLDTAKDEFVGDFGMSSNIEDIDRYIKEGSMINYIPHDYKELGLDIDDTYPLKAVYANKTFYHHSDMPTKNFYNIWQLAGTIEDVDHISNLSFQSPINEYTNKNFLLSLLDVRNQSMLSNSYRIYYGKEYTDSEPIGKKYVREFINNVSIWHTSDTKCLKEYLPNETDIHNVYFGNFMKMKDTPDISKVDWNFELNGFNSYLYGYYSSILNNAQHPYTACLFARYFLTPECFNIINLNERTPNSKGEPSMQYGYYSPLNNKELLSNDLDLTLDIWKNRSIIEDLDYLSLDHAEDISWINDLVNKVNPIV